MESLTAQLSKVQQELTKLEELYKQASENIDDDTIKLNLRVAASEINKIRRNQFSDNPDYNIFLYVAKEFDNR